jgi:hypothetical protein
MYVVWMEGPARVFLEQWSPLSTINLNTIRGHYKTLLAELPVIVFTLWFCVTLLFVRWRYLWR